VSRLLFVLATGGALGVALPAGALAQSMPGMDMRGMKMPAPASKPAPARPAAKRARKPLPRPAVKAPPERSAPSAAARPGHAGHEAMPGMDHQAMPGMTMPDAPAPAGAAPGMAMTGTALPAGNTPAPPPPADHYADRFYPAAEMAPSRSLMMRAAGNHAVRFNLAELQVRDGTSGYRWDGEAWFGGDINRLVLTSEGEGAFRRGIESAELQALFSHAVGPYFNLRAGVRHDIRPSPTRTYATIGFEGVAPHMIEIAGALFLSEKGELLGRIEGHYDQRITQRLVLQPRVEMNLAAQDVPATRTGSGLSKAELGLRLRYEITRRFAPYVGLSWERRFGDTARYARRAGDDVATRSFVGGVRFWF